MPLYHLSIKPISRATGRSATAAAAYRSGEMIVDERTGEVHDYTRKSDVEHSEIILPPGAPSWASDRALLWNEAEAAENRKDARVGREYEVAIPRELTRAQGIALVRDFSQTLADRYSVAVDFNIHRDHLRHWDGSEKGYQAYHAHILTSTRKLGRDGFGAKADPELSDTKRRSLGLDNGANEVGRVRELWEIAANRHLERASQAARIDRRSLQAQGIEREPTVHLGPIATDLERRGIHSDLGEINRRIEAAWREGLEERKEKVGLEGLLLDASGDLARAIKERDRVRAQQEAKGKAQGPAQDKAQEQQRTQAMAALKKQAAEGIAAFRARFEKQREAAAEALAQQRRQAAEQDRRGWGTKPAPGPQPEPEPPESSKNGPERQR